MSTVLSQKFTIINFFFTEDAVDLNKIYTLISTYMLLGHGLSRYVRSICKHPKLTSKQVNIRNVTMLHVDNSCGMSSPRCVRHSGQGTPQLKQTGMSLNQGIVQGSLTERAQFSLGYAGSFLRH